MREFVWKSCYLYVLTATLNPHPLGRGYSTLEFDMNIELDEVVVQDVSDDALELAAGGAQIAHAQGGWPAFSGGCSLSYC